jgi:hypothetical protein
MRAPTRGERIADMVRAVYEGAAAQPIGRILDLLGASNLRGMADSFTTPESGVRMGEMPGPPEGKILDKIKGIRAFHGSPHDFDKFSMDKIGTGEGAQAYGHGLYFAESEDVAKSYRDGLAAAADQYKSVSYGGVDYPGGTDRARLLRDVSKKGRAQVRIELEDEIERLADYAPDRAELLRGELDFIKSVRPDDVKFSGGGRMYEVAINATPDEFLDWDAPLAQQSPNVRAAIDRVLPAKPSPVLQRNGTYGVTMVRPDGSGDVFKAHRINASTPEAALDAFTGKDAYEYGRGFHDGPKASEELAAAGVKGIRYKDAMSRDGSGAGTHNYVVFDEKLVDILRKYGVAGAIGAGYTMSQIKAAQGETQ